MFDQNEPMYENNTSIYNYMFSDNFLWEIALFFLLTGVAIYLVSRGLSNLLGVKRNAFRNATPVNGLHQKVERTFQASGIVCIIVIYFTFPPESGTMYMMLSAIAIGFFSEMFRAVMEKKYAENPNEYKYTVIHFPVVLGVVLWIGYTIFPELTIQIISRFINGPENMT